MFAFRYCCVKRIWFAFCSFIFVISLGKYAKAEDLYHQCIKGCDHFYGSNHPETLKVVSNLADLYSLIGDLDKAVQNLMQCYNGLIASLSQDDPATLTAMNKLASLQQQNGKKKEALALYIECYEIRQKVLGDDHPDTLTTGNCLSYHIIHEEYLVFISYILQQPIWAVFMTPWVNIL